MKVTFIVRTNNVILIWIISHTLLNWYKCRRNNGCLWYNCQRSKKHFSSNHSKTLETYTRVLNWNVDQLVRWKHFCKILILYMLLNTSIFLFHSLKYADEIKATLSKQREVRIFHLAEILNPTFHVTTILTHQRFHP